MAREQKWVYRGPLEAGKTESVQLLDYDIDGLIIDVTPGHLGFGKRHYITLTVRDGKTQKHIMQRFPLYLLAEKWSMENGFDYETGDATDGEGATPPFQAFYVPLGSLQIRDGDILEMRLENSESTKIPMITVQMYHYGDSPDYAIVYNTTELPNALLPGCEEVYLMVDPGESTAIYDMDFTIDLKHDGVNEFLEPRDLAVANAVFGNSTGFVKKHMIRAYQVDDGIPDDVSINLIGTDHGKVFIMYTSRWLDVERVDKSTVRNAQRHADKLFRIEQKDDKRAEALRHSGIIAKSSTIQKIAITARSKQLTSKVVAKR